MRKLFRWVALVVLAAGCVSGCSGGSGGGVVVDTVSPFIGTYFGTFRAAAPSQDLIITINPDFTVRFEDNNTSAMADSFNMSGTFNPDTNQITASGVVFYGGDSGQQTTFSGVMEIGNGDIVGSGTWVIPATRVNGTWVVKKV